MHRGVREPPTNRGSPGSRPPRPQARQAPNAETSLLSQLRSALKIEDEPQQQRSPRPRGQRLQSDAPQESFLDQLRAKMVSGDENHSSRPSARSRSLQTRPEEESSSMLDQLRTKLGIVDGPQASSHQAEQRKTAEESRADSLLHQFREKILGTTDARVQAHARAEHDSIIDQFKARLMSSEHHETEKENEDTLEQLKAKVRIHSMKRKGSHDKVVVVEIGRTSCSSSSDSFIDVETVPCHNSPKHSLANTGVVVATQSGAILLPHQQFEDTPIRITCHHCTSQIITQLEYKKGNFTYILCGAMAAMGLILGCCLIPFFLKSCKDILHRCPNCHAVIGRHKRVC